MRKFFQSILIVLGLIHIAIGPTNTCQLFAWGKMFLDYSRESSFASAAGKTFDGEHPCDLCLVIEKERSKEKETPSPLSSERRDYQQLFAGKMISFLDGPAVRARRGPPAGERFFSERTLFFDLATPPPRSA